MSISNASAMVHARSMIEIIKESLTAGLAERNKAMADGYIASLFDSELIDRDQFEDLKAEAELAFTSWALKAADNQHL